MTADEIKARKLEYNRQYRKDHPEKEREHHRRYREKYPERVRASYKKWRENNPEKVKENIRKWREKNPEMARADDRRWSKNHPKHTAENTHRYRLKIRGLTIDDYNKMLSVQGGVCAICGELNKGGQRLSVDHNHNTGKNRGLLCGRCNTAIGLFRENADYLTAAISYLMEWESGAAQSRN